METFHINIKSSGPIKLHKSKCGMCKNGKGLHGTKGGKSAVWRGPFKTKSDARAAAKKDAPGRDIKDCGHCLEGVKKTR